MWMLDTASISSLVEINFYKGCSLLAILLIVTFWSGMLATRKKLPMDSVITILDKQVCFSWQLCIIYSHNYVCIYIHTYIHTCMHAYIHTYIHTYVHTYVRTVHTYIHTYTWLHMRLAKSNDSAWGPNVLTWVILQWALADSTGVHRRFTASTSTRTSASMWSCV